MAAPNLVPIVPMLFGQQLVTTRNYGEFEQNLNFWLAAS